MTDSFDSTQTQDVILDSPCHGQNATADELSRFRSLYQAEFAYVWNSLRRLGVRERDLEDLSHDLFMAVHRSLNDYDSSRPIRPWLFGFAFRIASDYRRLARNHREVIGDSDRQLIDSSPRPDQQLATLEKRQLVQEALEKLDLDQRAVFVMHDLDETSIPDIAHALKIPLNTAYSRLRLAREQFTSTVRRLQAQRGAL